MVRTIDETIVRDDLGTWLRTLRRTCMGHIFQIPPVNVVSIAIIEDMPYVRTPFQFVMQTYEIWLNCHQNIV